MGAESSSLLLESLGSLQNIVESIWEAEAGGLRVQSQPRLHNKTLPKNNSSAHTNKRYKMV